MYDLIKKNSNINPIIKLELQKMNGDYNLKEFKFIRNDGEHFISRHLKDNNEKEKYAENMISIDNGILKADLNLINDITNNVNYDNMKKIKIRIKDLQRKQDKYITIIKLCIVELGKAFRKKSFLFKQCNCFIPDPISIKFDVNLCEYSFELDTKYEILRENFRKVIDKKNETVFTIIENGTKIRDTLLIDSIFRAKEMTRSLNMFFFARPIKLMEE